VNAKPCFTKRVVIILLFKVENIGNSWLSFLFLCKLGRSGKYIYHNNNYYYGMIPHKLPIAGQH